MGPRLVPRQRRLIIVCPSIELSMSTYCARIDPVRAL